MADLLDGLLEQGESQLDRKCMFFMLENDTDAEITGLIGNKLLAMYQRPLFILKIKVPIIPNWFSCPILKGGNFAG